VTETPRPSETPPPLDPLGRLLAWWIGILSRHRLALALILLISGILFSAVSTRIVWQADVLLFFAADSADVRNVQRLTTEPGLANYMRFDVHLRDTNENLSDPVALRTASRDFAAALRRTGQFHWVWDGLSQDQLTSAYSSLMQQGVTLLDESAQQKLAARANREFLTQRFQSVAARLADPDGELAARRLASDPLGVSDFLADQLHTLQPAGSSGGDAASGGGGGVTIQDGMLTSPDHRHIMLIADPLALPSDQHAARRVIEAINTVTRDLAAQHPTVAVWSIGPHRSYVENSQRIVRDIRWVTLLGTLAVAAAIGLYFRRLAAVLLCLLPPAIGMGLALGLCGLGHATLPLIVLGFGGLLCGSTTDYGIQLIAACRRWHDRLGQWHADIPARATREMLGPITMSVATSITAFSALALSNSTGLRAMGLFVALATLCIWFITILILPACLGPWVLRKVDINGKQWGLGGHVRGVRLLALLLFAIATFYLANYALHIRFNPDPHSLDGSSAGLRAQEESFYQTWGDLRHRGIVILHAPDSSSLLTQLTRVHRFLEDQRSDGLIAAVTSPASLLPDTQTLEIRAAAWTTSWTPDRQSQLRADIASAASAAGFKPAAWNPWLDALSQPLTPASPEQRLAQSPATLFPGLITPDGKSASLIVQMRDDRSPRLATAWAGEVRLRYPDALIVSGDLLFFDATDRARAEAESLGPWTLLAILIPLWLYFRRISLATLAALCLFVGFIWVLGAAQVFTANGGGGMGGLNLLSLVPILFTMGVTGDYGIYAVTAARKNLTDAAHAPSRSGATFLCAATTILGTGSLVLASHPVMHWLGITLVMGIIGGYLASYLLVAPLAQWLQRSHARRGTLRRAAALLGRLALVGCIILIALPPVGEWQMRREKPAHVGPIPTWPLEQIADTQWRVGPSTLQKHAGLWEIHLRGTPEDIGYAAGKLGGPVDLRIENEMLDQLDQLLPQEWSRYLVLRAVGLNMLDLPRFTPPELQREIFAETRDYADPHSYLAPAYPRILSYHALHDISQMLIDNPLIVSQSFACTGVISTPAFSGDNHLWLARNFDFEGGESFARQKSITFYHPASTADIPFASVAWPGLSGTVTGMNRERLALFINAAATKDFRRIGTPTILMARQVLQHARTIDEALAIIRPTPVFVSDIIVLADGKTGRSVIVEKNPVDTAVWDVDRRAVVANHLVSDRFGVDPVNQERIRDGTTLMRHDRAAELLARLENHVTPESLVALLRDKQALGDRDIGLGNRNAIDGLIACHGVVMDVTAGKMWVSDWPHVEGPFIPFDVMTLLDDHAPQTQSSSLAVIPADPMLTDGRYKNFLTSLSHARHSAAFLQSGNFPAAQTAANQAIALNPRYYLGHELLGRAQLATGNRAAAIESFTRALSLDPPYAARRTALQEMLLQCTTPP